MSEQKSSDTFLGREELRLIFVGQVAREVLHDLGLGATGSLGAEFRVAMVEEAFEEMMAIASANGIRFLRPDKRVAGCPGAGMPPAGMEADGRGVCRVCGGIAALRQGVVLRAHRRRPKSSMTPERRAMFDAAAEDAMLDDGKAWYDVPLTLSESEQGEVRRRRFQQFFDKRNPLSELLAKTDP